MCLTCKLTVWNKNYSPLKTLEAHLLYKKKQFNDVMKDLRG